jgi:hypothetical protein
MVADIRTTPFLINLTQQDCFLMVCVTAFIINFFVPWIRVDHFFALRIIPLFYGSIQSP